MATKLSGPWCTRVGRAATHLDHNRDCDVASKWNDVLNRHCGVAWRRPRHQWLSSALWRLRVWLAACVAYVQTADTSNTNSNRNNERYICKQVRFFVRFAVISEMERDRDKSCTPLESLSGDCAFIKLPVKGYLHFGQAPSHTHRIRAKFSDQVPVTLLWYGNKCFDPRSDHA